MTTRPFYLTSVLLLLAAACGDDAVSLDGGSDGDVEAAIDQGQEMNVEMTTDAEIDAGPAQVLEDLPVDESLDVLSEHLTDVVNAVRDELGMWHIYGANLRDVFVVQGFLQARDRAGQMELIRRSAMGRLAEFGGALDPGLVDDDQAARFAGHARNAAAIFATLTVEEQDLILAHTEGINVYMEQIRDSTVRSPSVLLARSLFTDWSPVEVLSIARLQAASLSFDGEDDARNSENLAAWQENFPVDGAPELVARAGAFHDLFPFQPSPRVYNRDGFPNVDEDTGSRAIPAPRRPGPNVRAPLASLRAATDHFARMEAHYRSIFGGDEFRGSNSWVVSGEHTVSGFPLMANDPHLGLTSPPLFWQAHLNTARAGGDVNTAGQMIAGTPVNLLGFNEDIAWGLTTSGYDVTDVYMEQITPGEGGAPDTVLFNGAQVPIEIVNEEIAVSGQDEPTVLELELVPHHGFIVPGSREDTPDGIRALSVAWTGNAPSNELGAFLGLYTASTADEAREAFRLFEVGGQTLVMATRAGDIDYTSSVLIPIRPPAARTYNPATYDGVSPCFVLDGTGVHEWERDGEGNIVGVDERFIPHDRNPDKGFIATANADPVGVTDDGDPHNDAAFIGCNFAAGHRLARVDERLRELVAGDAITPADMSALQNDAISPHGRLITETLVRELGRALEERDAPGTHADLTAAVAEAADAIDDVAAARDRLAAWSFDTPAGVEGDPDATIVADSIATSIFNLVFSHLAALALDDEYDFFIDGVIDGERRRTNRASTTLDLMVTEPERLVSFDEDTGASILWDDLGTSDVTETMGERMLRATVAALASLEDRLGNDVDMWRWGRLHTLRLNAQVPALGVNPADIPRTDDPTFPDGFPRQGDRGVVDASSFGTFNLTSFSYRSGPQQRLVVELTPDGPRAVNAFPGGNVENPNSPFFRNQMDELWRVNRTAPVPFTEQEVVQAAASRIVFASE